MWLMTNIGFFSIVEKDDDHAENLLTIRARCRSDLLAIKALYLPEASGIETSSDNDYAYRIRAPRRATSAALAKLTSDIDYPNFKQHVLERQGKFRANIYGEVWHNLQVLQKAEDMAEWLEENWWRFPSGGAMPDTNEEVCILEVGLEGGSLKLMGIFNGNQWQFWKATSDQHAGLFSDEDFSSSKPSERVDILSWEQVSDMLTNDFIWFVGYPLHIHPFFARRILLLKEQCRD